MVLTKNAITNAFSKDFTNQPEAETDDLIEIIKSNDTICGSDEAIAFYLWPLASEMRNSLILQDNKGLRDGQSLN